MTPKPNRESGKMVLGVFLVKFDMKSGNSLVWSESQPGVNIDWTGIEFMAMPSGLHSKDKDVIRFVLSNSIRRTSEPITNNDDIVFRELFIHPEDHIEGIAVFRQNLKESTNYHGVDRSKVQMYSLGVLCPKSNSEISSTCWAFIDIISHLLDSFMKNDLNTIENEIQDNNSSGKFSTFRSLLGYSDDYFTLGNSHSHLNLAANHPILVTADLLDIYGPLIFELWKSTLLRDRILLVDPSRSISIESMCSFIYILTVFGTIPNDVFELIPNQQQRLLSSGANPIYNVTVSDIPSLHSLKHYIATTTDEIMIDKLALYDLIVLTTDTEVIAKRATIDIPGVKGPSGILSPGFQDKRRFQILMTSLGLTNNHHNQGQSIFNHIFNNITSLFSINALYGLLWWATAGEQANLDSDRYLEGLPILVTSTDSTNRRITEPESPYFAAVTESNPTMPLNEPWQISVIGYFQAKTRRIFEIVSSLIEAQDNDQSETPLPTVITIEPPDLMDMGLDPINSRDHEFIVEFINLYWGRPVRVNHICC